MNEGMQKHLETLVRSVKEGAQEVIVKSVDCVTALGLEIDFRSHEGLVSSIANLEKVDTAQLSTEDTKRVQELIWALRLSMHFSLCMNDEHINSLPAESFLLLYGAGAHHGLFSGTGGALDGSIPFVAAEIKRKEQSVRGQRSSRELQAVVYLLKLWKKEFGGLEPKKAKDMLREGTSERPLTLRLDGVNYEIYVDEEDKMIQVGNGVQKTPVSIERVKKYLQKIRDEEGGR